MSAPRLRLGAVGYLNTRPLVHGLRSGTGAGRFDVRYDVPSRLADLMRDGRVDIALLPVIELARMPGLEVVPGLSISARGPVRSVLLVSRVPLEAVRSVAPDPESRTSNALARILFARCWERDPWWTDGSASADEVDARVRIGDKALFHPRDEAPFVFDLAETWTDWTGLPFVFAVWAARPGAVDREVYRLLHDSRRAGTRAIETIAREYRWNERPVYNVVRSYLTESIRHRLGAAEVEGMRRFFREAVSVGLIDRAPDFRMALERWTVCHEAVAGSATTPCGH